MRRDGGFVIVNEAIQSPTIDSQISQVFDKYRERQSAQNHLLIMARCVFFENAPLSKPYIFIPRFGIVILQIFYIYIYTYSSYGALNYVEIAYGFDYVRYLARFSLFVCAAEDAMIFFTPSYYARRCSTLLADGKGGALVSIPYPKRHEYLKRVERSIGNIKMRGNIDVPPGNIFSIRAIKTRHGTTN